MSYLQRNKPNRTGTPHYVWILVVSGVLLLLLFILPKQMRVVSTSIAKPIWSVERGTIFVLNSIGGFFISKNVLLSQNLTLRDQVEALQLKTIDYDIITAENQNLKNLQVSRDVSGTNSGEVASSSQSNVRFHSNGLVSSNTKDRILARVLSKPPESPFDTLVLGSGSFEGVSIGEKVFLSDTLLVGIITDVTPHTSLVNLFSGSGEKTIVESTRTGASIELQGHGGANFIMNVPKDSDILWGDNFVYPALQSKILATVYFVDAAPQNSFKTIYLKIPKNIFATKWLFIEKM